MCATETVPTPVHGSTRLNKACVIKSSNAFAGRIQTFSLVANHCQACQDRLRMHSGIAAKQQRRSNCTYTRAHHAPRLRPYATVLRLLARTVVRELASRSEHSFPFAFNSSHRGETRHDLPHHTLYHSTTSAHYHERTGTCRARTGLIPHLPLYVGMHTHTLLSGHAARTRGALLRW